MAPILRTIELLGEQLLAFDGPAGERLRVLSGAAWLTQQDEPGDAVLETGAELALRGGRTLVQALGPTRLQILRTGRSPAPWRRLLSPVRRAVVRLQLGPVQPEPIA